MTQLRLGLTWLWLWLRLWPGRGPWLANQPEAYSASAPSPALSLFFILPLLNFVYLFSQEPHSEQICLMPGKGILLWSESHPRAQPKRQSNWGCSPAVAPPCCCSPCCCCCCCSLGCCYTQIARGNWQPLKESMQVAAAAAVGCCLLVVAPCWLTSIEARWMLSWEFAAQFDVTSNAQLATCNGQLGAAPELTLPPSKSARSWQYSHWAALRKTELRQTWCSFIWLSNWIWMHPFFSHSVLCP